MSILRLALLAVMAAAVPAMAADPPRPNTPKPCPKGQVELTSQITGFRYCAVPGGISVIGSGPQPVPIPRAPRGRCKLVPVMNTHTPPPYPLPEGRVQAQGTTLLQVMVARDGHVSAVKVARSSGFPQLDQAAASHVQQKYLWQPLACASARTKVKVVWDPAGICARIKSCGRKPN